MTKWFSPLLLNLLWSDEDSVAPGSGTPGRASASSCEAAAAEAVANTPTPVESRRKRQGWGVLELVHTSCVGALASQLLSHWELEIGHDGSIYTMEI